MTNLEKLVRAYIRDLIYPSQPSEEAVQKTVAEITAVMRPWLSISVPAHGYEQDK